jgi:hypothetical protein
MLKTLFDWAGYIATVVVFASAVKVTLLWARGVIPVLLRLGNGLANRKIAVFAKGDEQSKLVHLLIDSGIFREANIVGVRSRGEFGRAEATSVFLVYWPDCKDDIHEILRMKRDHTALVVYAPHDGGPIPTDFLVALNGKRNVVVNNFRGRLLNDLISCLITTSYDKN